MNNILILNVGTTEITASYPLIKTRSLLFSLYCIQMIQMIYLPISTYINIEKRKHHTSQI